MIQARIKPQEGCYFVYEITDEDGRVYIGGLTLQGHIFTDPDCPYKQMMFRAIINKCIDMPIKTVNTDGGWGFDLAPFGFEINGENYKADKDNLKLPRCC